MSIRQRQFLVAGGFVLAIALVVGIARASIPQDGVYTGCYLKSGGALRVIDPSQPCKQSETRITWNQQGQPGQAPAALVRTENWTPTDPGNPVHLTSASQWATLMTITKPAGGYWDKAVVTWSMNVGNWLATPGGIVCRIPNSQSTPMLQMYDGMAAGAGGFTHGVGGTLTYSTGYSSTAPSIELQCQVFPHDAPSYDIAVNWATLSVVPAQQFDNIVH